MKQKSGKYSRLVVWQGFILQLIRLEPDKVNNYASNDTSTKNKICIGNIPSFNDFHGWIGKTKAVWYLSEIAGEENRKIGWGHDLSSNLFYCNQVLPLQSRSSFVLLIARLNMKPGTSELPEIAFGFRRSARILLPSCPCLSHCDPRFSPVRGFFGVKQHTTQ